MHNYPQLFREEVAGILSDMEMLTRQLREDPDNSQLVALVKDSFSRVRQSVAVFGFDNMASFAHDVETVFENVNKGIIPLTPKLIGLAISARDNIWDHIKNSTDILDNDSIWVALELQVVSGNFSLSKAREANCS